MVKSPHCLNQTSEAQPHAMSVDKPETLEDK